MRATRLARELLRGVRDRRRFVRGVRILTYHGVIERRVDPRVDESFHLLADFRAHLAVLRRCRVISLAELREPDRSLRPRVAITFDDGFHNNLLAAELLGEARLPAAFFVTSEAVRTGETIWPTLLRLVLARGSARTLRIAGETYDLDGDPGAFGRARADFKRLPAPVRIARWDELLAQLRPGELGELRAAMPSIAMLAPRDVRALAAAGMTIGSHGLRHELQHADQPAGVCRSELVDSRAQVAEMSGRPCTMFAFPNGTHHAGSAALVRESGYEAAFTMVPRAAGASDDAMLLPRLVPPASSEKLITSLVYGN